MGEKRETELSGAAGEPFAPAFWEGKEAWKNEPGNRYSAEELRAMDREWEVTMERPGGRPVRDAN